MAVVVSVCFVAVVVMLVHLSCQVEFTVVYVSQYHVMQAYGLIIQYDSIHLYSYIVYSYID